MAEKDQGPSYSHGLVVCRIWRKNKSGKWTPGFAQYGSNCNGTYRL